MLMLSIALLAQLAEVSWHSTASDPHQAAFDDDAARMSRGVRGDVSKDLGEPLAPHVPQLDPTTHPWRSVTDGEMRARSGYWVLSDYKFHRSVWADMDHDGKPDLVEFVTNGEQGGLHVTYAAEGKPVRIVLRTATMWGDEAIFPAGPNGVLINQPESNAYFVYQRGEDVRAKFFGD
jgi:hypothetical protein